MVLLLFGRPRKLEAGASGAVDGAAKPGLRTPAPNPFHKK